jgi:hypothetical protein
MREIVATTVGDGNSWQALAAMVQNGDKKNVVP